MDARKTLLCSRCTIFGFSELVSCLIFVSGLAACQSVREDLVFISAFDSDFLIFFTNFCSEIVVIVDSCITETMREKFSI